MKDLEESSSGVWGRGLRTAGSWGQAIKELNCKVFGTGRLRRSDGTFQEVKAQGMVRLSSSHKGPKKYIQVEEIL